MLIKAWQVKRKLSVQNMITIIAHALTIKHTFFSTQCSALTLSLLTDSKYKPVFLPNHKLKVGETVSLKRYGVHSASNDEDDTEYAAIITAIKRFGIVITLIQVHINCMSSLPIELGGSCQM